jgi:hypothetical protein
LEVVLRNFLKGVCLATVVCLAATGLAFGAQSVQLSDAQTGVTLLNQDRNGLTLQLEIGEIYLSDVVTKKGVFNMISVAGMTGSGRIGEPDVPVASRLIQIPLGCELNVTVISSEVEEIDLGALGITTLLIPEQPSLSKSDDPALVPFLMDDASYAVSGYYTVPTVTSEITGISRGIRLGLIQMAPIEYNPQENKLRVHKNLVVDVSYEGADWTATEDLYERLYTPVFEAGYSQIINYEPPVSGMRSDLTNYPIHMLIVSDPMFEAQLQEFIDWKKLKGFIVTDVYTDEIGTSSTAIASFIESMYDTAEYAPSFVVLVGDDEEIPAFDGESGHITDLYFCEFTGDNLPEIYYGRMSARNAGDLQPYIDKTLEYEQYLMPDPSYLERVTLVSGVDGTYAILHGNGQINYGTNLYFDAAHGLYPDVWLYPASDASGAAADIVATVSEGVSLYNYTAHCGHTGHSDPPFTTSDLPGLQNYNEYLLGIGNCCTPNTFGASQGSDCFGEAFLKLEGKGGIGYIGATDNTMWDEDYWWGVGFGPVVAAGPAYEATGPGAYDGAFHDHGEPQSAWYVSNYAICYIGNIGVEQSTSSSKTYYWEAYMVMGDPSVMTYIGIPAVNNVVHDPTILMTVPTMTVSADPGSYVGITVDGELQGTGYVDQTGSVEITFAGFGAPCVASIVVTAQNREPYMSTIQVITPDGPYLVYTENDISDFAGNGNGMIDFGESITMSVLVTNVGPDDAVDVIATLITEDEFVMITDDTESYGTVLGGNGTGYVTDGFAFDVAGNIPDGHRIYFDLEMNGVERETWTSTFSMVAHAPSLEVLSIVINDDTGDNNGILDPGETADITVTLKNNGSGQVFGVNATASENDQYLTISDASSYFGMLDADGGVADNSGDMITLTADESCPLGYAVPVELTLTGDGGFGGTLLFNLTIGDRVPFFVEDFSFDQGWTGMGGSAEWTIGSPVGAGDDPSSDHTPTSDNYVLGNDLTTSGEYNVNIDQTYYAMSPIIDAASMSGCEMTYWHWNGCESSSYDHMWIEVYDGAAWVRLWENSATFQESEWTEEFYDLAGIADSNPNFQIRFGMGSTDGSVVGSGWNIDDIEVKGYGRVGLPALDIVNDPIADSLQPGASITETIKIKNTGEGTLRVTFTSDKEWMSFDESMQAIFPGDSLDFEITLSTVGVACGSHVGTLSYTTNDGGNPEGSIGVLMHIFAPDVLLSDATIEEYLQTNETSVHEMTITNNGPGRLDYLVGCQMFLQKDAGTKIASASNERVVIGRHEVDADKGDAAEPIYAAGGKGFGGPDTYGHNWIDSDEAGGPTLNWIDISALGTAVTLADDNATAAIPIGFGFPLYDSVYSELYIGSNGVLGFDEAISNRVNTILPNTVENGLVAVFWDDLDARMGGAIRYYHDVAEGRFIVSYDNVKFYYATTGTGDLSFQAVLYDDGTIQLNYGTMDPGDRNLIASTIGIQNSAQDDALEINANAEYVHTDLSIEITAQHWLSVVPAGGSVDPYSSTVVEVRFDATELPDAAYEGQIVVGSNDPDTPSQNIPVTLNVGSGVTYVCGDANNNGIGPDIEDLIYLVTYMFQGGPEPDIMASVDVNSTGDFPDIEDLIALVSFMFQNGPDLNCLY